MNKIIKINNIAADAADLKSAALRGTSPYLSGHQLLLLRHQEISLGIHQSQKAVVWAEVTRAEVAGPIRTQ
jgi:hypothetical protein